MVNRPARSQLALALRRLAAGRITNDEFEDLYYDTDSQPDDPALDELFTYGWLHYSDVCSAYKLSGRNALARDEKTAIARAVLFLKTDQDYVHGENLRIGTCRGKPFRRGVLFATVIAAAAGLYTHLALRSFILGFMLVIALTYVGYLLICAMRMVLSHWQTARLRAARDKTFWPFMDHRASMESFRFWPFANESAYYSALKNPPFLCGRRAV